MSEIIEELVQEEMMELALEKLKEGIVLESQIGMFYGLNDEQVSKVLEHYHNKVAVQA